MSQENERTILAMHAAMNRGDWDGVLRYCTPDAKFDTTRDLNETSGLYETHEEIKGALERFYGSWESWHGEVTEITHVDETLAVTREIGHFRARDGMEVTARTSSVWRFRDGRPCEWVHYREEDDARKAVGLSE